MKTKGKSASKAGPVDNQLPLDFNASKGQQHRQRSAEVVPISRQRTAAVRDVLVGDLIASKVPKKT